MTPLTLRTDAPCPAASSARHSEAMEFWFARINYEQRSPKPSDLKLDRMKTLLGLLGNPHQRLKIVHVAGSKGKGSTSAMLAAIARRAGYRTGLFTSPHLVQVEERFQIDQQPITPQELDELLLEIRDACAQPRGGEDLSQVLTFFEIATAAGFLHFVRRRVELAVLEVGLGGRLDSTNVCRPLLSIITSISFDHTQQLGNTLARIAFEKAGIVKPGRPVLSGAHDPAARDVIEKVCLERRAPLRQLDAEIRFEYEPAWISGAADEHRARVAVSTNLRRWPTMELGLIGEHQAANAALVVAGVEELRRLGLHISDAAVAEGLAEVHWPARLELLGRKPLVLLDCAHNVASAQALVQTLKTSFPVNAGVGKRLLIFAGSRDKDLRGMFEVLVPFFDQIFLTRFISNPRCVPPEQALELLSAVDRGKCILSDDCTEAWLQVRGRARADDLICITGSVFLAGEMLSIARK